MGPIEIFRVGTHTAMGGQTLSFDRDLLAAAVAGYEPALHEAPVVVGHPKDNHPAFGWIDHLELTTDGVVLAHPKQVDAQFAELVAQGRYKKRSASWYLPDSPANPKPGTLYLRHVGFLGAQPPALKGLRDIQFAEADGVVEFGDTSPYIWSTLGALLRGMRDWMIGEKGQDVADKVLPNFYITDLEQETQRQLSQPAPAPVTAFAETHMSQTNAGQPAAQAPVAPVAKDPREVQFSEREAQIAAREKALRTKEIGAEIDALITAGKVMPAQKDGLVAFMASLPDDSVVEFSEGAQSVKQSAREFMAKFLGSLPKAIEFGEMAPAGGAKNPTELSAQELADAAVAFREAQAAKGITISTSQAVAAVREGKGA